MVHGFLLLRTLMSIPKQLANCEVVDALSKGKLIRPQQPLDSKESPNYQPATQHQQQATKGGWFAVTRLAAEIMAACDGLERDNSLCVTELQAFARGTVHENFSKWLLEKNHQRSPQLALSWG